MPGNLHNWIQRRSDSPALLLFPGQVPMPKTREGDSGSIQPSLGDASVLHVSPGLLQEIWTPQM